jgi:hypothetical protein
MGVIDGDEPLAGLPEVSENGDELGRIHLEFRRARQGVFYRDESLCMLLADEQSAGLDRMARFCMLDDLVQNAGA